MVSINISLKMSGGKKLVIEGIDPAETTGAKLKALIEAENGVAASEQQLIYTGQVIKDDRTLESYKVIKDAAFHFVHTKKKKATAATPAAAPAAAAAPAGAASPSTAGSATTPGAPMSSEQEQQAHQLVTSLSQKPEVVARILSHYPALLNEPVVRQFVENPQTVLESPEDMKKLTELLVSSAQPAAVMSKDELALMFTRVLTKLNIDTTTPLDVATIGQSGPAMADSEDAAGDVAMADDTPMVPAGGAEPATDVPMGDSAPATDVAADEATEAALVQLGAMGFTNRTLNLQALRAVEGDVEGAVALLLDMMG